MAGFKGLNRFRKKYKKTKDDKLHDVTELAFGNLVSGSPVDVANFRGSWLGSVRVPRVGDPKAYRGKGSVAGSIQSQRHTNPGVSKGAPPTAYEKSNLAPALKAKFGQTVYVTNNLDYAEDLENGGSNQAPGGILKVQAQKTRAQISK